MVCSGVFAKIKDFFCSAEAPKWKPLSSLAFEAGDLKIQ